MRKASTEDMVVRFRWAMKLVNIPEEGIEPEKFFAQAGVYAGIPSDIILDVIRQFRARRGPGRVFRNNKRKTT